MSRVASRRLRASGNFASSKPKNKPKTDRLIDDSVPLQLLSGKNVDPLTTRELEVLPLVAAGLSNRQIAHDLILSLGTVKGYIHTIYSKLGVESRTQAVARELGLL